MVDLVSVAEIAHADIVTMMGVDRASIVSVNGTTMPSLVTDAHTLIATATASASATLEFTSGIDSTYDVYEFRFTKMHPANDSVNFGFQVNAVGQTGFNETITSAAFNAHLRENNTGALLGYQTGSDQAQGTAYQRIGSRATGNDNDQSTSGILTLYDPSSTTYVKHFMSNGNGAHSDDYTLTMPTAGYINTTSAIDEISFKFSSGNIDAGVIKMYGIKTS